MKKQDFSRKSHKSGSGGDFRRTNGRPNKTANGNTRGKNNRQAHAESVKLWMTPSSQTLTSHIPIVKKRNNDKSNGKGGNAGQKDRPYGSNDRNRPEGKNNKSFHQKKNRPQKNVRPQTESSNRNANSSPAQNPSVPGENESGPIKRVANIDPFELFCAYHLGIGPDNTYKPANINQVSARFNSNPATIKQATKEYGMDADSMLNKDFDMALAQLDIQVAPEGVSKIELAKTIYEEFLNVPDKKRDWKKILEEDRKENRRVFGDL